MKPFLKWAGSKYRIIDRIATSLPNGQRLIEPFAGSGAVFLNTEFEEYLVADSNPDLINLFQHIKENGTEFISYSETLFNPKNNTETAFYELRDEFNNCTASDRRSALFIYLNRHCFNGLCRYNSKGKFNVPFGRYSKPTYPKSEVLNFHQKSSKAIFEVADYKTTMSKADINSVVYCDPPYAPLTSTSNFSDYTQEGFSLNDQKSLAEWAQRLFDRGIPVVISNHDTAFTRAMYAGSKITSFEVQRFISSVTKNRNKAAELIAIYD